MSLTTHDAMALQAAVTRHAAVMGVAVSCCIVNSDGRELITVRMDNAGWFTAAIARSKAVSAATLRSDSGDLAPLIERHPELASLIGDQLPVPFTTLAGAVVARNGDGEVIGAIGVSGATSEQDVELARAALAEWQGQ